ncbi:MULTISPECIES: DUF4302 domain-containing protein [Bacteroides]|uniref:DUF4302 domain-containing protein n=1 Tax=Bacteroides TaxID=816 RepID=UPI001C3E13AB|nr:MULTISPECIES: DUF4302 domain-containing protein [Bacteroides]
MKRNLLYLIMLSLLTVVIVACDKTEDRIFDQSPDERLNAKMAEYQQTLLSSPNGWLMSINSKVNGGYLFWLSFNDKNRVTMLADIEATFPKAGATSTVPIESSYKLKALLAPSLIFDTYSYLHILADPQGEYNGGTNSEGLKSDFEFSILDIDNGSIYLQGNYNNCEVLMTPATPQDAEAIMNGGLKTIHDNLGTYLVNTKYPFIDIDGTKILVRPESRNTSFTYINKNGELTDNATGSFLDLSSCTSDNKSSNIHFFSPIEVLGKKISGLKWNGEKYLAITENEAIEISDSAEPLFACPLGYNQVFKEIYTDADAMQGTLTEPFISTIYTPAFNRLYKNSRKIQNMSCTFFMNVTTGEPYMQLGITYWSMSAERSYTAKWNYPYRTNDDGTITFYDREQTGVSNEFNNEKSLIELVDYFCGLTYKSYSGSWSQVIKDVITPHTFRIDWVPNKTLGLSGLFGGFYQVDNTDMCWAGKLKK